MCVLPGSHSERENKLIKPDLTDNTIFSDYGYNKFTFLINEVMSEGREEKQRIANDYNQERLLKTTSKQGLINLCKSLREQLAKERELTQTKVDYYEDKLESMQRTLDSWYNDLQKERELRKELVEWGEVLLRNTRFVGIFPDSSIKLEALIKKGT